MRDCKKHYSATYATRLGEAPCPWCELEKARAENDELCNMIYKINANLGADWVQKLASSLPKPKAG